MYFEVSATTGRPDKMFIVTKSIGVPAMILPYDHKVAKEPLLLLHIVHTAGIIGVRRG